MFYIGLGLLMLLGGIRMLCTFHNNSIADWIVRNRKWLYTRFYLWYLTKLEH